MYPTAREEMPSVHVSCGDQVKVSCACCCDQANPVRSSRMMPGGMDGGDGYDDFDMMEGPGRKVGGRLKRNRFKDTPSRGARNK